MGFCINEILTNGTFEWKSKTLGNIKIIRFNKDIRLDLKISFFKNKKKITDAQINDFNYENVDSLELARNIIRVSSDKESKITDTQIDQLNEEELSNFVEQFIQNNSNKPFTVFEDFSKLENESNYVFLKRVIQKLNLKDISDNKEMELRIKETYDNRLQSLIDFNSKKSDIYNSITENHNDFITKNESLNDISNTNFILRVIVRENCNISSRIDMLNNTISTILIEAFFYFEKSSEEIKRLVEHANKANSSSKKMFFGSTVMLIFSIFISGYSIYSSNQSSDKIEKVLIEINKNQKLLIQNSDTFGNPSSTYISQNIKKD